MRRRGFTLVEVLIVVVIMAVLAATIIPQFTDSTKDAKTSTGKFNLHTLRSQIELYKVQHDGLVPTAGLVELTSATSADGQVGTGTDYPFGPYLLQIPPNPFNNIDVVAAPSSVPPTDVVDGAGWLYDPNTGRLWLNHVDFLSQ